MKDALRAEDVLCGDESPVNMLRKDTDAFGRPLPGAPHAVTLRTPDQRLIWYVPINSRSSDEIGDLGVLTDWHGVLVRDDYNGWKQFDATLAGVQQCLAHLIRHCKAVPALAEGGEQGWARTVMTVLREAGAAVACARDAGDDQLDPHLLADLRERFDMATGWGILTNRLRDWHDGNHLGYRLAKRLTDKAEQVWLFTRNFAVPWTNNASEQALRGPKRHQAVSGYWHTPSTLGAYLRIRSYLASAHGHGIPPIDAIHRALAGHPGYPPQPDHPVNGHGPGVPGCLVRTVCGRCGAAPHHRPSGPPGAVDALGQDGGGRSGVASGQDPDRVLQGRQPSGPVPGHRVHVPGVHVPAARSQGQARGDVHRVPARDQ
jgi:hypothetical protein